MDRRREMERWLALREREGLTFRELASRSGISAGTLGHWAWKLRRARDGAGRRGQRLVELVTDGVSASGSSSRVEIVLRSDRRVIVDAAIDADALLRVLAIVERC